MFQLEVLPPSKTKTYLDECLLHFLGDVIARRQPVVVGLKLGGHHEVSQPLPLAQPVEVEVGHLPRPQVAQLALVDGGVDAEQVRRGRVLEERVPCSQALFLSAFWGGF